MQLNIIVFLLAIAVIIMAKVTFSTRYSISDVRMQKRSWIGLVLDLAGVILLVTAPSLAANGILSPGFSILWISTPILLAGCFLSVSPFLNAKIARKELADSK